jgi:hypothetical protein
VITVVKKKEKEEELSSTEAVRLAGLALVKSIEDQLKEQGKKGYPVIEGLKNTKELRRYLKKVGK